MTADSSRARTISRRILILGLPGAGKTRLASSLSRLTGLPAIECDPLIYDAAWKRRSAAERVAAVLGETSASPEGWICDGGDGATLEPVLALADTVVWLRLPFLVVWSRLIRRHIVWSWRRENLWGDHRITWLSSFSHPDSVVWWTLRRRGAYHRWIGRTLRAYPQCTVFELRSDAEVAQFLTLVEPGGSGAVIRQAPAVKSDR